MLRRLLLATIAVLLATGPGTALAAFPGRNGLLAVQPRSGAGIVLVAPDGSRVRRICTNALLCGRPVAPRFSPDGRAIVFDDARSLQIAIVGTDGNCLWCLLGRPLTQGFGHDPAFSGDGTATATVRSDVGDRSARQGRVCRGDA